jgi:LacI family transcriptional regulator
MKRKTTLQNIADELNITKVTVSRALKGQNGVGDDLRQKIEDKAVEMGYSRSSLHVENRVQNFVFITPTRFFLKTEHFYTDIYYYLHRLCDQKKYRLVLQIIDPDMEDSLELPNSLMDTGLSGIFIGGEISRDYLGKIEALHLPTVVIDYFSTYQTFSHITVDNFYLGYKAALHLIERGHSQIGFVGQKDVSSNVADRMLGIQKALGENGISLRDEWVIENHDPRTGLYSLEFLLPEDLPTAFICHCDRAAYFLIEKLKMRGLSVPEDVSIVSFDDTEIARDTTPPLTSFKIDRNLFAEKGMELIEKRLEESPGGQERVYLETVLIERESVKTL